jgi:hypothetical protein
LQKGNSRSPDFSLLSEDSIELEAWIIMFATAFRGLEKRDFNLRRTFIGWITACDSGGDADNDGDDVDGDPVPLPLLELAMRWV